MDELIVKGIEVTNPDVKTTNAHVSKRQIVEALVKHHGILADAARELGVARNSLGTRVRGNKDLAAICMSCREEVVDLAESQLVKKVKEGDIRSVLFVLNKLGKNRGYGDEVVIKADVNTTDLSNLSVEELEKLNELVKKTTNITGDTERA